MWFALSLIFVVGSIAFAVDFLRLQNAKSIAQSITVNAVRMASSNASLMSQNDLQQFVESYTGELIDNVNASGSIHLILQTVTVEKEVTDAGLLYSVTMSLKLSYTLLPLIGFEDLFAVNSKASALLDPSAIDVVVLTDNQHTAIPLYLSSLTYLIDQFELQTDMGNTFRLGAVLSAGEEVNVAPRIEWVDESWPQDIIPPTVEGTVEWIGALADQNWCILPREGSARVDFTPPQLSLFKTSLEFNQNTASDGSISYSIRDNLNCPKIAIEPLSTNWADLRLPTSLPAPTEPAFILERGLLWAGRVLAEEWATSWPVQSQNGSPHRKIILFFIGSSVSGMSNSLSEFVEVCRLLEENEIELFVVDISNMLENQNLLSSCTALTGYIPVQNQILFEMAIADFSKSLLRFKLTEVK